MAESDPPILHVGGPDAVHQGGHGHFQLIKAATDTFNRVIKHYQQALRSFSPLFRALAPTARSDSEAVKLVARRQRRHRQQLARKYGIHPVTGTRLAWVVFDETTPPRDNSRRRMQVAYNARYRARKGRR